jgi:hypothetical protein
MGQRHLTIRPAAAGQLPVAGGHAAMSMNQTQRRSRRQLIRIDSQIPERHSGAAAGHPAPNHPPPTPHPSPLTLPLARPPARWPARRPANPLSP